MTFLSLRGAKVQERLDKTNSHKSGAKLDAHHLVDTHTFNKYLFPPLDWDCSKAAVLVSGINMAEFACSPS